MSEVQPSEGVPDGSRVLDEIRSKELVAAYRIPVIPTRLAVDSDDAVRAAAALGLPAALKIVSPDVPHKSDVGGVRLDLATADAVRQAFGELAALARPSRRFDGVAVQPMAPRGLELLLGAYRDPQFGPVVTVGLGGVMVELYDDVAVRVAPLTKRDAGEMLQEVRGRRIFDGFRGSTPIAQAAVVDVLLALSDLMLARPDVREIDLNPVFAYEDRLLVADARVVLGS
jgi:acetate---CoA ligase (ADP-forming) subunit beta